MADECRHLHLEKAQERARRKLGTRAPRCEACGETEPLALSMRDDHIHCYACIQQSRGRPSHEPHHVATHQVDATLTVPIANNEHRVLSELQTRWMRELPKGRLDSPLIRWAASIAGWLDILYRALQQLDALPKFLRALDCWLVERLSPRWWEQFSQWKDDHDKNS